MSDRRRRIEALRAKARSTTFPAEAEALRAKADELEKLVPVTNLDAHRRPPPNWAASANISTGTTIRFHGNVFEQMGGIRINFNTPPGPTFEPGQRVQVTNVNGQTYWITVE